MLKKYLHYKLRLCKVPEFEVLDISCIEKWYILKYAPEKERFDKVLGKNFF